MLQTSHAIDHEPPPPGGACSIAHGEFVRMGQGTSEVQNPSNSQISGSQRSLAPLRFFEPRRIYDGQL
jgi:hypothetical protein